MDDIQLDHHPSHTDMALNLDHEPVLVLAPHLAPADDAVVTGPFPGNVCGVCGATVEVVVLEAEPS